jgi:hypothetical protein
MRSSLLDGKHELSEEFLASSAARSASKANWESAPALGIWLRSVGYIQINTNEQGKRKYVEKTCRRLQLFHVQTTSWRRPTAKGASTWKALGDMSMSVMLQPVQRSVIVRTTLAPWSRNGKAHDCRFINRRSKGILQVAVICWLQTGLVFGFTPLYPLGQ